MARNQYSYAKRQRDLAKQKKKEEKRLRKLAKNNPSPAVEGESSIDDQPSA